MDKRRDTNENTRKETSAPFASHVERDLPGMQWGYASP